MTLWTRAALKSVFVPGGVILALAALLFHESWIPLSSAGISFFYYSVFVAALALSLRFDPCALSLAPSCCFWPTML
jgi:hypothetical protein